MSAGPAALDVVVVGAIGLDTSVFLRGADVDFSVEANFSENLDYVGGAGGYCARGFAQLGKRTGFIGFIGDDPPGGVIARDLAADGVESLLFTDPAGSRRSVNLMYRDGRRKNFYDARGSMEVSPDLDRCRALLRRTRLVHFSIENWARQLLPLARDLGLVIACDLQDMVSPDDAYRQDFIAAADILFLSAANLADAAAVAGHLVAARPEQIVVVGMGSRGCGLGTPAGWREFAPVALPVPVIDTNGAGDGLAVGLLAAHYLDGYSLDDAVLRGQIVARYTCTQKASTAHLIRPAQLDASFAQLRGAPGA